MKDPVQRHPTRAEQLDILTAVIADVTPAGGRVLELGVGKGYVAHLLAEKRRDIQLTGVDLSGEALAEAAMNLEGRTDGLNLIEGDLSDFAGIDLGVGSFDAIFTALVFHDLDDEAKRRVIAGVAERLAEGGLFLLYDRVRLTEPALFAAQKSIWDRIERVHEAPMRTAEDFESYIEDLGTDNRPAALADYGPWFAEAGLAMACLHLHGNVALLAGARPS